MPLTSEKRHPDADSTHRLNLEAFNLSTERVRLLVDALRQRLNSALRGKQSVVELVLAGLLGRGHLLFEDLPGLGKTTLAKALADALGGVYARVQCTPDLLPGDVTGFSMFNQKTREFEFRPGPVFADVLLADEINRATPRTQSALLEAMAERQVTVDNIRHPLSETFLVLATQNPLEHYGTNPLPEAQLDRFAMKLRIGFPNRESERAMLAAAIGPDLVPREKSAVLTTAELAALQRYTASIMVQARVQDFLLELVARTRQRPELGGGISPRGALIWQRIAQAWAVLANRDFVTPDDVLDVALPVLSVRLGLPSDADESWLDELTKGIAVPT